MAKIYAPNKEYTGVSATVAFAKGVGETDDEHLIEWFRDHGYEVEEENKEYFLENGGEKYVYVSPFNEDMAFAELVKEIAEKK